MRSPQGTAGRGTGRLSGAQANRVLLILVAAGVVAALVVAPEAWRWPSVCGVVVAGATLAQMLTRHGWAGRLTMCLIGGLLTVAAVTVWQAQSRVYGVAAAAVTVVLYPAIRLAEPWDETDRRRRHFLGFLRGLAIGTAVAVAALVVLGLFERNQASFAMRYGQRVTVVVDQYCADLRGARCDGSTWMIDGRSYTGQLLLGPGETAGRRKDAYVVPGDRRAYTARHYSAPIDGLEIYGFVPSWPGLPILLLMVLVALPARLWRRLGPGTATTRPGIEARP